jgi:general nucleoside transport system ATP-binding protein
VAPRLELRLITKRFPSVLANDQVSLTVQKGTIHALVGENGAGKSTLMNILYGLYHPDAGEILLDGKPVTIASPTHAIGHGIGMVHQHFMLVPSFTVYENVVLAMEPRRGPFGWFIDRPKALADVAELARQNGFKIDPHAKVRNLSVGTQQRVEILKALYRGADILILDEPTAVLTPQETRELFVILRGLVDSGKTILFITHKLEEVMAISDHVTVMRQGKVTMSKPTRETAIPEIARMMVGRDVLLEVPKKPLNAGEPKLSVRNLWVADDRGLLAVKGVSLNVRAGEIVGIAGVAGNGQSELVEAITGLRPTLAGQITVCDQDVTGKAPLAIRSAGLAHIPEDRFKRGVAGAASVAENAAMIFHARPEFAKDLSMDYAAVAAHAEAVLEKFDVRPRDPGVKAGQLSGGNVQKLIAGREISLGTPVLIAAQPTRGVDLGAIEFLHRRLVAMREAGHAVLLISTELDEIMSLSDRILVMCEGEVTGEVAGPEATPEALGLLMAGVRQTERRELA